MLTFHFTRPQIEEKRAEAKAKYGLELVGDSGTTEYMNVGVQYVYDESAQTLTLTILHKPFYYPQSLVLSAIQSAFAT